MYIDDKFTILNPKRFNKRPDAYQICSRLDNMDKNYYIDDGIEDVEEVIIHNRDNNRDFCRFHELFDEETDIVDEEYSKYNEDETLPERAYALALVDGLTTPIYHQIDTDFPQITILKNNKTISEEQIIRTLSNLNNPTIQEMFSNGETLNTIANLFYGAYLDKEFDGKYLNESLLKDGYKMIKEHYPLDFVIKSMGKATQKYIGLGDVYLNGSLEYLTKYPEYKNMYIIKYPNANIEFFDPNAAILVEKLLAVCNDADTMKTVINATRINTTNKISVKTVDNKLAEVAIKLVEKNNGKWTTTDTKILTSLKREYFMSPQERVHKKSYKTALNLLDSNMTSEEILKVLQSIE